MYYPLSTGQQPRFGGLDEQRQLAFEAGTPWFPGDFPDTKAGWEWEVMQRRKRGEDWKKRPKSKRVSWESVQVGEGKEGKGEVGVGWACDWEILLHLDGNQPTKKTLQTHPQMNGTDHTKAEKKESDKGVDLPALPPKPKSLTHIDSASAFAVLNTPSTNPTSNLDRKLLNVHLTLLTRGVPQTCARIYRLPSAIANPQLRKVWLALHPRSHSSQKQKKKALPRLFKGAAPQILQQRLAASLLEPPKAGGLEYPSCPSREDLVGFVTSGNFNLAEGKGTGVGCLLFGKVVEQAKADEEEGRLCIVRNAGESVGRLARWDLV